MDLFSRNELDGNYDEETWGVTASYRDFGPKKPSLQKKTSTLSKWGALRAGQMRIVGRRVTGTVLGIRAEGLVPFPLDPSHVFGRQGCWQRTWSRSYLPAAPWARAQPSRSGVLAERRMAYGTPPRDPGPQSEVFVTGPHPAPSVFPS